MDIDLWYMPVTRPYNPNGKRVAEMMQSDLAKLGVNAKLVTYEWGEYRKRLQAGEHITGQLGWTGDNGDPDNFFFCLAVLPPVPVGRTTKWCDKGFEDLIEKARGPADVRPSAPSFMSRHRSS